MSPDCLQKGERGPSQSSPHWWSRNCTSTPLPVCGVNFDCWLKQLLNNNTCRWCTIVWICLGSLLPPPPALAWGNTGLSADLPPLKCSGALPATNKTLSPISCIKFSHMINSRLLSSRSSATWSMYLIYPMPIHLSSMSSSVWLASRRERQVVSSGSLNTARTWNMEELDGIIFSEYNLKQARM